MAAAQTYQSEFTGSQMDERFRAVATLAEALTVLEQAIAAKYTKPADGIPSTDMDASVQSALALALTSVQSLADYYTKSQVDSIAAAIAATINATSGEVVASLPTASASTLGKIYYVGPTSGEYDRYVTSYDGTTYSWLQIGSTDVDMTQYATKDELSQLDQEINGIAADSKTVTLAVTAGTGVTYNNSLKECRLYKGRTYRIVLSGTINAISMYFRNAANSESITVDYDDAGASGTNISFASNVKEHTVTPREDVFYVRFYAGASSITNTGDMVWSFDAGAIMGVADKADYAYDNILIVAPKAEEALAGLQEIAPKVDALDDGLANTRNISPLPANIEVPGTGIVFGTQGVTMLPVGRYVISFEITADPSNIVLDCLGYFIGVSGGVNLINQQGATTGRVAIGWNFEYPLDRLLFRSHNAVEGTITLSNIQIESIAWDGYTSSPNKGDWAPLPYATPYIPKQTLLDDVAREFADSYWRGKKINYNGDSITQGIGTARVGYVKVVNQLLQFGTVRNYAIGGTRLAHVNDVVNCLVDRIEEMSTDADVVFIMANTNDYASQVPIGSSDSSDESTYNGALNSIFAWLKANYPTQPIIISTMLTRKVNYADNEPLPITIEQYAEAVRQKVAEYGFILYDAYKWSGLDLLNTPTDGTGVSDDGLHPNAAGALALGRKVAKFIDAQ